MQRYFFNVHDRDGALLDPEGTELLDDAAARRAAVVFVRSLLGPDRVEQDRCGEA
jgi:cytochrome c-type biogenesis protein CcmH/NrfG